MRVLGACALVLVGVVAATMPASGATSSMVVSVEVPSATTLTNACTSTAATGLGVLLPDASATTSTSAPCSISFASSNNASTLRIAARDGIAPGLAAPDAAWKTGRTGVSTRILATTAYSAAVAIAVDGLGAVHRTQDSGVTWARHVVAPDRLYDVEPVPGDSQRWVMVGEGGIVRSTTNALSSLPGAATWTDHNAALLAGGWPVANQVNGVAVQNNTTWIVGGGGGYFARTTDSGATWNTWQLGAAWEAIMDIDLVAGDEFIAVTVGGRMHRTTTAGAAVGTWVTSIPVSGILEAFADLSVGDATHVYAVGRTSGVYRWNGANLSMVTLPTGGTTALTAIAAVPATPTTVSVAGERGIVWRSGDSGGTWTAEQSSESSTIMSLATPTAAATYAGSTLDTIMTAAGATWTTRRIDATRSPWFAIDADPVDGRRAIAVGDGGLIHRTTDGGTTWNAVASGVTQDLLGVTWASASSVWAVGANGTIIRSTDGGVTWTAQVSGLPTTTLRDVAAADEWTAYVVGAGGTILTTSNGGTSWTSQASGTTLELQGVATTSATTAFVVGGTYQRRTVDGGATWTVPAGPIPGTIQLVDIASSTGSTLIVGALGNGTYRSVDAGATWAVADWNSSYSVDADGPVVTATSINGSGVSRNSGVTWTWDAGPGIAGDHTWQHVIAAIDGNTQMVAAGDGGLRDRDEHSLATYRFGDYGGGSNFGSGSATSTFGVCLQGIAAAAPGGGWIVDGGGTCTATDADPWRALPAAPTTLATAALGVTGNVTLVWGARPRVDQPAGAYSAGVVFEAIAP